jgi:tetratricopeptide (TPR) repeat protein
MLCASLVKKLIAILILLALGTAAWFWGLPAYRAKKERKFAAQAEKFLAAKDLRAALLSAQQTLVLNPSNLVACEVMADVADAGRSPHAITWRKRIAEISSTVSNQVILASCALRYEQPPFAMAQQALDQLKGSAQSFAPYHVVSAQLAIKQGRIADAEKHFEAAIRLEPADQLHQLNLATVRLQSRDAAVASAAHQQLVALQTNSAVGTHAARSLAAHHAGRGEFAEALKYSGGLVQRAEATFDDRLEHLTVLKLAKNPEFNGYANELRKTAGTNAVLVFALTGRLLASGETNSTLAWLKSLPASVRNEQPAPLAMANTYAALSDWRGLEEFLRGQNWKEQEFVRLGLLAYAVRNQNDEAVSRVHWEKAMRAASERSETLALLTQMAIGWRWNAEAEEVLWRAAKTYPKERWPVEILVATYTRDGNSRGLYSVFTMLCERDAEDRVAQNNFAALSLLLGTNVSRAHEVAAKVYSANTNEPGFVSTYAWSLHLQGKTGDALQLMEGIPATQLSHPAFASYYGALLAASGQNAKAKEYLAKAEQAPILPEERALVEEAKRKL